MALCSWFSLLIVNLLFTHRFFVKVTNKHKGDNLVLGKSMIHSRIPDQSSVWRGSAKAISYHGGKEVTGVAGWSCPGSCQVEVGKGSSCSRSSLSKHNEGSGLAFGGMKEVYTNTKEMLGSGRTYS